MKQMIVTNSACLFSVLVGVNFNVANYQLTRQMIIKAPAGGTIS